MSVELDTHHFDKLYDFKSWDNNWVVGDYMLETYGSDTVLNKNMDSDLEALKLDISLYRIRFAAESGFLEYVKWLHKTSDTNKAISKGNVEVLIWAHDNNLYIHSWSNIYCAIKRGDLAALQYLHSLYPDCLLDQALVTSNKYGRKEIADWILSIQP